MDLYELTRNFVRRGCEEHPRLTPTEKREGAPLVWVLSSDGGKWFRPVDDSDARDLWTMHALEWFKGLKPQQDIHVEHEEHEGWAVSSCFDKDCAGWHCAPTILEAIEAATRHLEPVPAKR